MPFSYENRTPPVAALGLFLALGGAFLIPCPEAEAQQQNPSGPETLTAPQPSATTPPTPLPRKAPDVRPYGVKKEDIRPIGAFQQETPGQPLPDDPKVIRTLNDALAVALRRDPNLLNAQERVFRVQKTIRQILGGQGPQIQGGASYTRLSSQAAGFGGFGGVGFSPGQVQNPFPVGLQQQAPGSVPVTLSGGSAAGTPQSGQTGATTATGAAAAGSAGAAGQTRSADTRQTDGGDGSGNEGGGQRPQQPGNGGGFGPGGVNLNQYALNATVSQFIDITGVFRAARQLGDLEEALSLLEIARLRQDVAFSVKNAYYNLLRAQAFVRVNEAAVAQSEELLRVTQAQKNAGVASEFDVLRARTQLENNRQALISSRNQVAIARNAFANTVGVDPSTPVEPESPTIPDIPDLNEQALVEKAMQQRPEYAQADINILKADRNIRLARRNLEPFLNAIASGNYNPEPAFFADQKATGSIRLQLTVPLWDGGATREAVESAKSDRRSAFITKDQYVRGIKSEVQQAIIAVRDADERRSVTKQTVLQAREALRLAGVRFRAGVGTQLDVNDAQTALTQAETNAVNAEYDYLGALARLARVTGTPE